MARRGLSVNEVARALISMMVGAKQLQFETGYIDARPLTHQIDEPLATHGRTIHPGQKATFS
jgi:hypothetical protein